MTVGRRKDSSPDAAVLANPHLRARGPALPLFDDGPFSNNRHISSRAQQRKQTISIATIIVTVVIKLSLFLLFSYFCYDNYGR